jgi:hypothetical protein
LSAPAGGYVPQRIRSRLMLAGRGTATTPAAALELVLEGYRAASRSSVRSGFQVTCSCAFWKREGSTEAWVINLVRAPGGPAATYVLRMWVAYITVTNYFPRINGGM